MLSLIESANTAASASFSAPSAGPPRPAAAVWRPKVARSLQGPGAALLLLAALLFVGLWAPALAADEGKVPPPPAERLAEFEEHVREGHKRKIRKILEQPDFAELRSESGQSPAFALLRSEDAEIMDQVLTGLKPDFEHVDGDGKTVLRLAAEQGKALLVRRLLAAGADPESADEFGRPALLYASLGGHLETVSALLEGGAEVDPKDHKGGTPLLYACAKGFYAVPKLLLDNGADATVATHDGTTAVELAIRQNARRVVRLLRRHGAS
ncbi:MAG: ankyrin repeat domain-containing protein [Acidobacteriota bacterium]